MIIGKTFGSRMIGGLLLTLAQKKVHAGTPLKIGDSIKLPLGLLDSLIKPKPKPTIRLNSDIRFL